MAHEMERSKYLERANWTGGFYELAIAFEPAGDDVRLLAGVRALWSHPRLLGPWAQKAEFPNAARCVDLSGLSMESEYDTPQLYGVLSLPDGEQVGCLSLGYHVEGEASWLVLDIPMAMLGAVYPERYPLSLAEDPWLAGVHDALLSIADHLYPAVPFDLAMIGWEVAGNATAGTLTSEEAAKGGYIVPPPLLDHLRLTGGSVSLASGLRWVPYDPSSVELGIG